LVGIDWGSETHQVAVLDSEGRLIWEGAVPHREEGVRQLLDQLRVLSDDELETVAVAIEMPRGAVVEALVEAGAHV
jgi:predicted NBD/HSP70 family sugar kinase